MTGIVYKRPGSPYWYVSRTRQSCKTVNRKQAEEFARKVLTVVWRQTTLGEYNTTWKELGDDWLEAKEGKKTLDKDKLVIANITKLLGSDDKPATDVNGDLIAKYAKGFNKSTANRHLVIIRAMLRRAKKNKQIAEMPNIEFFSLPSTAGQARWLTHEQLAEFLLLFPAWAQELILMGAHTGLRASNVRGLRWDWVKENFLIVPAVFTKTQETYTVPISDVARQILESNKGKNDVYVFVRPDGVCPVPNIRTMWESAREKFGMPKLRFHDLRHTFASWHRQNGTPDHILKEIGGWKSNAMLDNYAKVGAVHLTQYANNLVKSA